MVEFACFGACSNRCRTVNTQQGKLTGFRVDGCYRICSVVRCYAVGNRGHCSGKNRQGIFGSHSDRKGDWIKGERLVNHSVLLTENDIDRTSTFAISHFYGHLRLYRIYSFIDACSNGHARVSRIYRKRELRVA